MTHTPGPWTVQPNPIGGKHIIIAAATDRPRATLEVIAAVPPHNAKNVPLLLAAPVLLSACERFARHWDADEFELGMLALDDMRAAIAEAEGRAR